MGTVVEFERFKDVTGWSIWKIREYTKSQGWKNLKIHMPKKDSDPVRVERLPAGD
jgi:hypothetical protein